MRMAVMMLVGIAMLPMAACNRETGEKKQAVAAENAASGTPAETERADASAAAGSTPSLKPGQWETTTEMLEMKMEGAPTAANEAFKPTRTVTRHCVTPNQASAAVPNFEPPQHGGRCDIKRRNWSGGTIDMAMTCSGPNGEGKAEIASTGRYDDDRFTMDNRTAMTGPNGVRIDSRMRISGQRVGDCAG